MAIEHDLPGFLHAAAAEIDALGNAQDRALRAQAPADAARHAQQHGIAILGQRGLHAWMKMEADDKALARAAGQAILAAQILAVGSQEKLPRMGQAMALLVAVMARRDPL